MVQEVGIISWLIYFLLDNKSLSVFTESSTRQNSSLVFKAKLHSSITSTINNSKKLNSIIARALDEISEEINLTNNLASIIIDDSILSHSIIIKSKKYDNIDQQIREESQLKWGDKTSNYYFVSEEKKTPKNIFHSVAIHHFLKEKIKKIHMKPEVETKLREKKKLINIILKCYTKHNNFYFSFH